MAVIFIRTFIIFVVLVIVIRLMGKRQIGEMQPFEFIVTLIIADLACIPMADVSIPLIYGIVAVLTLFLLHQLLSLLEQKGDFFKKVISGKPSIVIDKDGVNLNELKKNNMGIDDLIESMRASGYFSFDDLDYAIFESNGKLSPFPNNQREKSPTSIPVLLINEGKIVSRNLSLLQCDKQDILTYISNIKVKRKNVEVMTVDGNGRTYLKQHGKKYQILSFNIKEGVKW